MKKNPKILLPGNKLKEEYQAVRRGRKTFPKGKSPGELDPWNTRDWPLGKGPKGPKKNAPLFQKKGGGGGTRGEGTKNPGSGEKGPQKPKKIPRGGGKKKNPRGERGERGSLAGNHERGGKKSPQTKKYGTSRETSPPGGYRGLNYKYTPSV